VPDWESEIKRRLAGLHLAPTREGAVIEELSQDLADCYAELLSSGATEAEAYQRTLAELGETEIFVPLRQAGDKKKKMCLWRQKMRKRERPMLLIWPKLFFR